MNKKFYTSYLKIIIGLLFLATISNRSQAQVEQEIRATTDNYAADLSSLSLYGETNLFYQENNIAYTFGGRLELKTGIWGFYYKLGLGANPDGKLYGHIPLGVQVGIYVAGYGIINNETYYMLILGALCAMVPEGVTVRFWERNNQNLRIYLSPWGSELNLSKEHFTLISGEFGVQYTAISKQRYNVSCYAGTKMLYKNFVPAATIGATVGILID